MIKLTKSNPTATHTAIRVEGELTAQTLPQFRGLLAGPSPSIPNTVTIDLSGLMTIDHEGRGFLIGLREAGYQLVGGSLYIKQLLEEV